MNTTFAISSKKLLHVDYAFFRKTLDVAAGSKIKSKGLSTLLYDKRDRFLALVQAPSIDQEGRCNPAQYFVNKQQISPLSQVYTVQPSVSLSA